MKFFFLSILLLVYTFYSSCGASAEVNVKAFGAKGNGIADDTKAIREAFASLAKTGGTIHFPKGVYLTEVIDIRPVKGVTLMVKGEDKASSVKLKPGADKSIAVFFCEVSGVRLHFEDLTVNGSSMERIRTWKTTAEKQVEVDQQVNGIFTYNVQELSVKNCFINQVHGDGIACYSAERFTANRNTVSNVSGTGIKGHRVITMDVNYNDISNCGLLSDGYVLDGEAKKFDSNAPFTKFGDGIEAASKYLNATHNKILNPGRCGIVHDLARDLNFLGSKASVSNNSVTINSLKVNSNNPPAGMWFEQTAHIIADNNTIVMLNSKNVLTSAIRFYEISESIFCSNNMIVADSYNKLGDNAIGVFEPLAKDIKLLKNTIRGRFRSAIVVSYEKTVSRISDLIIKGNYIYGKGLIGQGIWISVSGDKHYPDRTDISSNTIQGVKITPYNLSYYGQVGTKKVNSIVDLKNNITEPRFVDLQIEAPIGVQINRK